MTNTGIYFRVDKKLLEKFTRIAELRGMSRSEALRKAMKMFVEASIRREESATSKMRGLVKSKLTSKELEEAYLVSK